jgi:predicted GTPase
MPRQRIVILGAAGRDFHDFNVVFRDDPTVEVVAFTATQIPNIDGRRYPASLAGPSYPSGIPIEPEDRLEDLVAQRSVDQVVLSYSDLAHADVMHLASRALAAGAEFRMLGPRRTMLRSERPVVAVCAVRTGCGKSPACRYVTGLLRAAGHRVAVIRHPMPYGDLARQRVQRFETLADLDAEGDNITIEEREEYEPHIEAGSIVYAGVDYGEILRRADAEADVIVWDGGNNDLPFVRPDLWITLVDPHRPGHELGYHPGEANLRAADIVVISKVATADPAAVATVRDNVRAANPRAQVIEASLDVRADDPASIEGRRVLLVDDGPTLTHGGMSDGAGRVAALEYKAAEIVDPRPSAVGSIAEVFRRFPHVGRTIPAMGYYPAQVLDLQRSIRAVDCDTVVVATPIDLRRLIEIEVPVVRVRYEFAERTPAALAGRLEQMMRRGAGRGEHAHGISE